MHFNCSCLSTESLAFEAKCFPPIPQLRKFCTIDGNLNRHILVRAVRLTVETNLMTSKDLRAFDVIMWTLSHARSATVSIVALVMFAAFPVSRSAHHVRSSIELDTSNTGVELVYVSVCIQFHFFKYLSCVSSDTSYDLNHLLDSTYILGKL